MAAGRPDPGSEFARLSRKRHQTDAESKRWKRLYSAHLEAMTLDEAQRIVAEAWQHGGKIRSIAAAGLLIVAAYVNDQDEVQQLERLLLLGKDGA